MTLVTSLVVCSRWNSLRLAGNRVGSQVFHQHHVRLSSTFQVSPGLQRVRLGPTNVNAFRISLQSRSYTKPSASHVVPQGDPPVPEVATSSSATTYAQNTETVSAAPVLPEPTTPAAAANVDVPPSDMLADIADAPTSLMSVPPPLEFGDLSALGLISYTPAGLIRWSLEVLNVVTGMPWFWTIVVGSLLWRIVVTPFVVQSLQNTARLMPLQPQLAQLRDEMQRAGGDRLAMQRAALKQKKIYADAGVSMGKMIITPFIQLPVTLGLFFGIRKMCSLPVEQLKVSGLDILPDLTVADPYCILPLALMVMVNVQISVGAREMNLTERPQMGHLFNGLRILTLLGVYVMSDFPSGLMVSLLVTSGATTLQTLILQRRSVRRALNIPIVPRDMQGRLPTYKESIKFVIDEYKKKVAEAQKLQHQQRRR